MAESLLTLASSFALRALGVQVIVDDSHPRESPSDSVVHVFDGFGLLDFLVARVALGVNVAFIPGNLLKERIFFKSTLPSEISDLVGFSVVDVRRRVRFSLSVRSGSGSISSKPWLVARSCGALVVPWFLYYDGQKSLPGTRQYGILKLFASRIVSPLLFVRFKRGCSSLRGRPDDATKDEFLEKLNALYAIEGSMSEPS